MKKIYLLKSALLIMILSLQGFNVTAQSVTFNYTGAVQTWTVPPCVTSITVDAQGAIGGHSTFSRGGYGGRVQCTLAVTPGSILNIYVGGKGDSAVAVGPTTGGAGGFNGGANGAWAYSDYAGGGGGGASDIRIPPYTLTERVVVAAGGGGGGYDYSTTDDDRGGDGGGLTGDHGWHGGSSTSVNAGEGGTPTAGGAGGSYGTWIPGTNGALGLGGDCGASGTPTSTAGGGGGGGLYGGGGGSWGGGGGGSSATHATLATAVTHTIGFNTVSNGAVTITPVCLPAGTITGTTYSVCAGSTISLTNPTSVSCGTWTSSTPGVAAIGASTGVVTGVSAGTAVITYTVDNPCGPLATQTITVNPAPAAITGTPTACVGATTTLANTDAGGTWTSGTTSVATIDAAGTVTGVAAGTSTITYTLPTTCYTTSAVTITVCTGAAVNDVNGNKPMLNLYPNPASAELNAELPEGTTSITITDMVGRTMLTKQVTNRAAHKLTLNVAGIPAGNYILKTISNDKTYINKVTIVR